VEKKAWKRKLMKQKPKVVAVSRASKNADLIKTGTFCCKQLTSTPFYVTSFGSTINLKHHIHSFKPGEMLIFIPFTLSIKLVYQIQTVTPHTVP